MTRTLTRFLASLAILACAPAAIAQKQLVTVERFDETKGLNVTYLSEIYQDTVGFLWIATREGLARFDGYNFRFFRNVPGDSTSIRSNHVFCMKEDAGGNLWAGLYRGGVSRYDRATGKFKNYPFTDKLPLKTATVHCMLFDKNGRLWMGVGALGLVHLDTLTGEFRQYDIVTALSAPHFNEQGIQNLNIVQNIWQDENSKIWCATPDDIYEFDPKTGVATPRRSLQPVAGGFDRMQAFCLHNEGDLLWTGGWNSGLRCYNRRTSEWKQFYYNFESQSASAKNTVNGILPKGEDELWILSGDKGLGIFNKKNGQFSWLAEDKNNGHPDLPNGGNDLFIMDKQGNFWISHNGSTLLRVQMRDQLFHYHPTPSKSPTGLPAYFLSVLFEDRERRFLFSGYQAGDGLSVLEKSTREVFVPKVEEIYGTDEPGRIVQDVLQKKDGSIWVLGRHHLYRFNPQTKQLEMPPQPPVFSPNNKSNLYNKFTEDANGNLWLCTSTFGLFRYQTATGKTTHFMPDEHDPHSVPVHIIGSIKADRQGRVWYGSRNMTAYGYYLEEENRFVRLDASGEITQDKASMRMNTFFTDLEGDIWACTEQGLLHFDCAGERPYLVKKYTVADGLPTDYVEWGTAALDGDIWGFAVKFLFRLNPTTGDLTLFGPEEGIPPHSAVNNGRMLDGRIFLNGLAGYHTFDPATMRKSERKSPIVLTSFKVNDGERYHGSEIRPAKPLVVGSEGRFFTLEYAALDLGGTAGLHYEYKLQGFDNQWVEAGTRRNVTFTNIPGGHYSFLVKLAGAPDAEALEVSLIVKVAFYKTTTFWVLAMAGLAGMLLRYFQIRRQQERQVADLTSKTQLLEKEKAVVMYESLRQQLNPHFLFNSLSSLGSLIQIDPKTAVGFLENLSKTYRYILKSSERELVPLSEELKFAESFVKLQQTRFGEGLQVRVDVPEDFLHLKIVPVTLQNLLENAIKHNIIDEESPLVVEVFVADNYLVVRNNLQRKKFVETSNRTGLANLQSFYGYLTERNIEVAEDGAFFTIKIPLI